MSSHARHESSQHHSHQTAASDVRFQIGSAEEAQFEADLLELAPFLRSFARSLSRDKEAAQDLAQETLLRAWRARGDYKPGTNLKAWLCIIMRNKFYSDGRRSWRQMPWDQEKAERISLYNPEQTGAADLSDTVRALGFISADQREALTLVGAGGFSYKDAAVICNCAVGTLKSRVARARNTLASLLEGKRTLPRAAHDAGRQGIDEIMTELARLALGTGRVGVLATRRH